MQVLAPPRALDVPKVRTFMGLMELYEQNYIRVRRLCAAAPGLPVGAHRLSERPGALDLHLRVVERTRYTETLLLTYYLQEDAVGFSPVPNLYVRVFNDARQAEVLSRVCARTRMRVTPRSFGLDSELTCKWRLNRFLYKWLGYCLHQGHRFGP